jgi:hypothetical protein
MINHYGSLSFGHYISVIKNLEENLWYQYDDSHRTLISEDSIQKETAYILFYIRKDVQAMTHLDQVMPSIKQNYFPGKPITTERGDAFVIANETNGMFFDFFIVQILQGKLRSNTVKASGRRWCPWRTYKPRRTMTRSHMTPSRWRKLRRTKERNKESRQGGARHCAKASEGPH